MYNVVGGACRLRTTRIIEHVFNARGEYKYEERNGIGEKSLLERSLGCADGSDPVAEEAPYPKNAQSGIQEP